MYIEHHRMNEWIIGATTKEDADLLDRLMPAIASAFQAGPEGSGVSPQDAASSTLQPLDPSRAPTTSRAEV